MASEIPIRPRRLHVEPTRGVAHETAEEQAARTSRHVAALYASFAAGFERMARARFATITPSPPPLDDLDREIQAAVCGVDRNVDVHGPHVGAPARDAAEWDRERAALVPSIVRSVAVGAHVRIGTIHRPSVLLPRWTKEGGERA